MRQLISGMASVVLLVGVAHAQDLFEPANHPAESSAIALSGRIFDVSPGDTLELALPDGAQHRVVFDHSDISSTGDRLWVGHLTGGGDAYRVILTHGVAATFGYIATPEGAWTLAPIEAGGPLILSPDYGPPVEPGTDEIRRRVSTVAAPSIPSFSEEIADAVQFGSNGTIDIAIVYTDGMRTYYGLGLGTRMQHLVNVLDQALVDSDTGIRARFVGATLVPGPWNEFTSTLESIDDLYAGASYGHPGTERDVDGNCSGGANACINDGDLSSLLAFRNAVGADIVVMLRRYWRAQQTYCGVAYVPGYGAEGSIDPTEDWVLGVAVTGDGPDGNGTPANCGDLTFSHEVGHNMGSTHNIENASSPGVFTYSYGHRYDCNYRTIMGYDSTRSGVNCPGSGFQNETWLTRFSNPAQNDCVTGACGVPDGGALPQGSPTDNMTTPTDNARSMRDAGYNVRDYRNTGVTVRSAILPYSRTVSAGSAATAFVSVVNPASSGTAATDCGLQLHGAAAFSFQPTDPQTNAPVGSPGDLVDIPAGGIATFVFSLTEVGSRSFADLRIDTACGNRGSAPVIAGVNTFRFTSTALSLPDIVALAATAQSDGRVNLPTGGGASAFSVATANLGSVGSVVVTPERGLNTPALQTLEICRTNATTGVCETPRASSVTQLFQANGSHTFAVFVRSGGAVANDPANNRIFVHFRTPGGQSVGATSVAVRTQ
jgi:plastocyanin